MKVNELLTEAVGVKKGQILTFKKTFDGDFTIASTKAIGKAQGRGRDRIAPEKIYISNNSSDKNFSKIKGKKVVVSRSSGDNIIFKFEDDIETQYTRFSKDGGSIRSGQNLKDHEFSINKTQAKQVFADLTE